MIDNVKYGVLEAFWETGTEGVYWAFIDNNETGYNALNILKNGDYLFVEDGNGKIGWEGEVKLEYKTNKVARPTNPNFKQQLAMGYWVHGLQENVDPDTWATWFLEERPAVLRKRDGTSTTD